MSFEDDLSVFLEILFWTFIAFLVIALIIVTVKFGIITYICCKKDELTQVPVPVNTVSYTVPVDGQHQVNIQLSYLSRLLLNLLNIMQMNVKKLTLVKEQICQISPLHTRKLL